jgi:hypothetical protein
MAKWRRPDPGTIPKPLRRYVENDWPGHDPIGQWRDACIQWLRESPGRSLPFGEYGDSVAVIRESARIKMELARRAGEQ